MFMISYNIFATEMYNEFSWFLILEKMLWHPYGKKKKQNNDCKYNRRCLLRKSKGMRTSLFIDKTDKKSWKMFSVELFIKI